MATDPSPTKGARRSRSGSILQSKSSDAVPGGAKGAPPATKLVGASDLVLAFEKTYGLSKPGPGGAAATAEDGGRTRLSKQELDMLLSKETLRVRSTKGKKKSGVQELFGGEVTNYGNAENQLQNWQQLDIAKKERRIRSIMERRNSMKFDLEKLLDESIPIPKTILEYPELLKDPMHPPLVLPSDQNMLVELGDPETRFDDQLSFLHIEKRDVEVLPFRDWFLNQPHVLYVATDSVAGPVVLAIQRQKKDKVTGAIAENCRVLVRSKDVDEWLFIPSQTKSGELLDAFKKAMPAFASLKFSKVKSQKAASLAAKIVEMEEMMTIKRTVKFGVLLCKGGQEDENKMFQNSMTPALEEFLEFMGTKIELSGWTGFAGGLDTSAECRTGKSTYYTEIDEFKLLFHVSTMLPYFPLDEQQLERKRHLGNDIVCVIFLEEDANSDVEHFFDPSWLHTGFTHVFFVVSPDREMTKKTGVTHYRLAVACHSGTTPFGPRIPAPAVFPKGPELRSFFLTKLINSERAALTAPAFQARLQKVKETYLSTMFKLL
eukprot:TRINITY_DN5475_c0_g1_i1.p1 TRINITY_DN5475_c0_g1~~TRINITY_DN5475_c0_g1_i1.p1  ORF type:complete len:546 (-),score=122.39 TRINITY_DN5475_c0_g1_i1:265-1902(-)